ncbi:MAG: DUF1540 domain-containing protein [Butyrivibrio sp.]
MTDLGCCVTNCVYNAEHMCCKNSIKVIGKSATDSGSTCCGSYKGDYSQSAQNSSSAPNPKMDIRCDAVNCMHNDDKRCVASHVEVRTSADTVHGQTECSTFKMR